ncbi:hypothetical protein ALC56_14183 [Trachymyrmex septentrionalis]|uniref:Uncharacterized protein n=1 Tax=Trachymyrmex septentrionalis TaxID=34720 RepID=A0A195ETR5_9HYME|nr:hypothetical protein ALC56_14183 [Trachymyrmex septentrionalis]
MPIVPYKTKEAPCTDSPCYMSRVSAPLVPQEVNLERFSLETANTHIGRCIAPGQIPVFLLKKKFGIQRTSFMRYRPRFVRILSKVHLWVTNDPRERDNWYQEYRYPIKFKHSFPALPANADGVINRVYIGERNSWPRGKPVGRGQRGDKETEEKEEVEEMDEWARETRNEVKIDSAGETSGSVLLTSGTIDTRRKAKEIKRQGENTKTSERRRERKTRPAIKSHQKFHFAITDAKSKQNHGRFVNYIFHWIFFIA